MAFPVRLFNANDMDNANTMPKTPPASPLFSNRVGDWGSHNQSGGGGEGGGPAVIQQPKQQQSNETSETRKGNNKVKTSEVPHDDIDRMEGEGGTGGRGPISDKEYVAIRRQSFQERCDLFRELQEYHKNHQQKGNLAALP